MKQFYLFTVLSIFLCANLSAAPAKSNNKEAADKPLKIVFDNDVHGSIDRYAYLAGFRDQLRDNGYPVLTVSVGDYLQGSAYASMSRGQFCVDMINAVGYDVVAVGNHDIDYGIQHLLHLRDSLHRCAMVCCNLLNANNQRCVQPYTICHVGDYKVAFIGVLTTATEQLQANVVFDRQGNRQCSFAKDSLVEVVQKTIDEVRLGQPDWVILLTHMGEEPLGSHLASWQLVEQLSGVDAVIDAHSHSVVNTLMMNNTMDQEIVVAQTGSTLKNIGCLTLQRGEAVQVKLYTASNMPKSPAVEMAYQQVEEAMQPILGQVVGYTPFDLQFSINGQRAVRRMETNLGDLVADAYRIELGTDIGWVNGGGIRRGIDMGDVTYGQMVSVSPFSNSMCVARINGQMLADALEECYNKCPIDLGGFGQISGIRCVVDTTIQNVLSWDDDNHLIVLGERRVSQIEVYKDDAWHPIQMDDTYTIGSTNYVIYDGELQSMKNARLVKDKVMTDTECLQRYITTTLAGVIPAEYHQAQERIMYK